MYNVFVLFTHNTAKYVLISVLHFSGVKMTYLAVLGINYHFCLFLLQLITQNSQNTHRTTHLMVLLRDGNKKRCLLCDIIKLLFVLNVIAFNKFTFNHLIKSKNGLLQVSNYITGTQNRLELVI